MYFRIYSICQVFLAKVYLDSSCCTYVPILFYSLPIVNDIVYHDGSIREVSLDLGHLQCTFSSHYGFFKGIQIPYEGHE